MTVIAVLLVITLIGFLSTIGYIIAVALSFRKLPSRIVAMTAPTKNHVIGIANTGRRIADTGKRRYGGYAKQGVRIYAAVKETGDDIGKAAGSVNFGDAASAVRHATATVNAAQEGLAAVKAVLEVLGRNKAE